MNSRHKKVAQRIGVLTMLCILLFSNSFSQSLISHHKVHDQFEVDVYTPENYSRSKKYKTIYFNDGESVFFGWGMQQKLDDLIKKKTIEPIIAVAIHTGGNRLSWYNPYDDDWIRRNWGDYQPQAEQYTKSIRDHLVPFIEKNYSVENVSGARAILGASMGGLHATWAGLHYADLFGFSIAMSPSYWVADERISQEPITQKKGSRFWLDVGTAEWQYYVPFYKKFQQAGYEAGKDCLYYEIKDGAHTPSYWMDRIDYPLIAFAGTSQDYEVKAMDLVFECIRSQSVPGKIYQRINAIGQLANGIQCTLANGATYAITKGNFRILDDGTIIADKDEAGEVTVTYKQFTKKISFTLGNCR